MPIRRVFLLFIFLLTPLISMEQEQLIVTIDHSIRQSVRLQKIVKESLLIKMGIEPKKNAKRLSKTSKWLEEDLNAFLQEGKQAYLEGDTQTKIFNFEDKEIKDKLIEFKKIWNTLKPKIKNIYLNKSANSKDLEYIIQKSNRLYVLNNEITKKIVDKVKKSNLKYLNDIVYVGKVKILTQILSKDILLRFNKIDTLKSNDEIKETIKNIDRIYYGLINGDKALGIVGTKYPPVVKRLKESLKKWEEAKRLIENVLVSKKIDKDKIIKMIAKMDSARVLIRKAGVFYEHSVEKQEQFLALESIIKDFENKENNSKHLINIAGRQRMLTQRIPKLAIECAYKLQNNNCYDMLKDVELYNKTLRAFKKGNQNMRIDAIKSTKAKEQIKKIDKIWKPFVINIISFVKSDSKDKKSLKYILDNNIKLLKESHKLVKILQKEEFKDLTEVEKMQLYIVNIAGKERMLSQKMTKEYLEYHFLNKKEAKEQMIDSINKFDTILDILLNGNNQLRVPKVTNLKIKKQLTLVKDIWDKLKPYYLKEQIEDKKLKLLLKANPILLNKMNEVVFMIENTTNY